MFGLMAPERLESIIGGNRDSRNDSRRKELRAHVFKHKHKPERMI